MTDDKARHATINPDVAYTLNRRPE
jgi:hypothetical protein